MALSLSSDQLDLVERVAERAALALIRAESFAQCLRLNHLAEDLTIPQPDADPVVLRGKDVISQRTWLSFLKTSPITEQRLAYQVGPLAQSYVQWLRTSYTERYQVVQSQKEIAWLTEVARLAVLWQMMLQKHRTHQMRDLWVDAEMSKLVLLRDFCKQAAKAVNRNVKEPEVAQHLIELLFDRAYAIVQSQPFVSCEPLLPLPDGLADPLALPEASEEGVLLDG